MLILSQRYVSNSVNGYENIILLLGFKINK